MHSMRLVGYYKLGNKSEMYIRIKRYFAFKRDFVAWWNLPRVLGSHRRSNCHFGLVMEKASPQFLPDLAGAELLLAMEFAATATTDKNHVSPLCCSNLYPNLGS